MKKQQEAMLLGTFLALIPSLWRFPKALERLRQNRGQNAGRRAGLRCWAGPHTRPRPDPQAEPAVPTVPIVPGDTQCWVLEAPEFRASNRQGQKGKYQNPE